MNSAVDFGSLIIVREEQMQPTFRTGHEINPADKTRRKRGLNYAERSEFAGICKVRPEQLIECYATVDRFLRPVNFVEMCRRCPYSYKTGENPIYLPIDLTPRYPYFITKWNGDLLASTKEAKAFVYFISDGEFVKIGSAKNVESRIGGIQTGNPRAITILATVPCAGRTQASKLELCLHNVFSNFRMRGEWFNILHLCDWDTYSSYFDCDFEIDMEDINND